MFIIGEAPGYTEDMQGLPWVGKAGGLLRKAYIEHFQFPEEVDVYLSNAVKCRPPKNKTPNLTQLKACQGYYLADILHLQKCYEEVIVLATGATSCKSILGVSLKKSLNQQGEHTDFRALTARTPKSITALGEIVGPYLTNPAAPPFPTPCRVFTTYHPAALLRDPNKGPAVEAHLSTLKRFLGGTLAYEIKGDEMEYEVAPLPPSYPIRQLSLDIETYGILEGQNQTQFHPLKSVLYDEVRKENLCVTTGLTHRQLSGSLRHCIFVMSDSTHRRKLWSWLRACRTQRNDFEFLLGQNIKFDLMYLRFAYPECGVWLDHPLTIQDLTVTNYLHNEGRPERSLKALAPLLGVTKYRLGGFRQYPDEQSPDLWRYNVQDSAATLRSQEVLEDLISSAYGADTPKLSEFNRKWYSDLLWLTIWMEEAGITMSAPELRGLLQSYEERLRKLEAGIKNRWGLSLRGKGSEKTKREVMKNAIIACRVGGAPVPPLEKTTVRQEISYCEENRNALMSVLPHDVEPYKQLRAITAMHTVTGILDRYLYPLLVGRGSKHNDPSTKLIESTIYPRWYPVPSDWEDGSGGGTKQCRIVAKGPAVQTFPPKVKACMSSRYQYLLWFDYSQIELRMAALLSNDPWMMGEYSKPNCDFHLATAHRLFPEETGKRFRQVGKTLNFLVIYLGGAKQYQTTLMRDEGIARRLDQCQIDIDTWWGCAQGLRKWQNELMEFVQKHGYFELPLVGQSRLFLGNKRQRQDQIKEIVNMPVQAVAANITLSAQFELALAFKQRHMRAVTPLNVYDAATIECHECELPVVLSLLKRILPNPPYYRALCEELGRSLPLDYDVKIRRIAT